MIATALTEGIVRCTRSLFAAGGFDKGPVVLAVGLVILLAIVWATFIRKPDDRRHSRHHWRRSRASADFHEHHHRRWSLLRLRRRRRRRHRERPCNPTLAETGGLPAVRPTDSPPPTDSI